MTFKNGGFCLFFPGGKNNFTVLRKTYTFYISGIGLRKKNLSEK